MDIDNNTRKKIENAAKTEIIETILLRHEGINSKILKARTIDDMDIAIKFYRNEGGNDGLRCIREIAALKYLGGLGDVNCPKLITYSKEDNWCAYRWIEGKRTKRYTKKSLRETCQLIIKANMKGVDRESRIPKAKDWLKNEDNFRLEVAKLIMVTREDITKHAKNRDNMQKCNEILDIINYGEEKWLKKGIVNDKETKSEFEARKIWSPSDIGIHNTIETREGCYFIDFEYAGIDDKLKLLSDLVLQPNNPLGKEDELYVISEIKYLLNRGGEEWEKRYRRIKPIVAMKWLYIMTRKLDKIKAENKDEQLDKIKNYIEKIKLCDME